MLDRDRGLYFPHEFQPLPGYRDFEKAPYVVTKQTDVLLGLYRQGAINHPEPAREYLHDYTIGCLNAAEQGSETVFSAQGLLAGTGDLESVEAARFALVVFAWMPEYFRTPSPETTLIRSNVIRVPKNQHEHFQRIRELKLNLFRIAFGGIPQSTLRSPVTDAPLLRTLAFFEVGSRIPVRLSGSEKTKEQEVREKFNNLLGDLQIDLN